MRHAPAHANRRCNRSAPPALAKTFGRSIQAVEALPPEAGQWIAELAGGLPPAPTFHEHPARWDEPGGDWGGKRLPPEEIVEASCSTRIASRNASASPHASSRSASARSLDEITIQTIASQDGTVLG